MSFFNPKVYNYSNLKEDDKRTFNSMYYMMKQVGNYKEFNMNDIDEETVLEKLRFEISCDVLDEVLGVLNSELVEFIVSRIDNYDEDVAEIDTDSYFYGFEDFDSCDDLN